MSEKWFLFRFFRWDLRSLSYFHQRKHGCAIAIGTPHLPNNSIILRVLSPKIEEPKRFPSTGNGPNGSNHKGMVKKSSLRERKIQTPLGIHKSPAEFPLLPLGPKEVDQVNLCPKYLKSTRPQSSMHMDKSLKDGS